MAWLYLNEFWEASIVLGMEKVTTLLLLKLLVLMTSLSAAIFMSSVISSSVGVAVWIDISSSEAKGGPTKKDQINLDSHFALIFINVNTLISARWLTSTA